MNRAVHRCCSQCRYSRGDATYQTATIDDGATRRTLLVEDTVVTQVCPTGPTRWRQRRPSSVSMDNEKYLLPPAPVECRTV
jgi:hypothetical protein